jgi:preprotein translocase subunit SecF
MRIIGETNIPFLSYRWIALAVSGTLILGGLGLTFFGPGLNKGIDFVGGTQVTVKFQEEPDLQRLREALAGLDAGTPVIQQFDEIEKHEILIRVQNPEDTSGDFTGSILDLLHREFDPQLGGRFDLNAGGAQELTEILMASDPDGVGADFDQRRATYRPMAEAVSAYRKEHGIFSSTDELDQIEALSEPTRAFLETASGTGLFSLLGAESVGPAVGADLRKKATLAIVFSLVGMMIYIWVRFQLPYGLGAVVALFHDVLITLGALTLTQREVNLPTIAALLTLVGYSVNDTVVVFDRVRENLRIRRDMALRPLMDLSINQVLSRTLITSGTTLVVVLSLYLFGGDVINTFAFVLLIGIIVGTYSSVFVAAPVALAVTLRLEAWKKTKRSKRR